MTTTSEAGPPLYAEDLTVGRRFALASRTLTSAEIVEFAQAWDPLPMHVDPAAAAEGPFGGLIASGLHTIAVLVRMSSDAVVSRTAVIAGRGMRDVQMRKPVRAGMRLTGTLTVVGQDLRDDGTAVSTWDMRLADDEDDLVLQLVTEAKVRRRGA